MAAFVSANQSDVQAGNLVFAVPAGVQDGDCLVVGFVTRDKSPATPVGWAQLELRDLSTQDNIALYVREASSEPGAHTWTFTDGSVPVASGTIIAIRDVQLVGLVSGSDQSTHVAPSLTSLSSGMLITFWGTYFAGSYSAVDASMSQVEITNGLTGNLSHCSAYQSVGSGSTGTRTATGTATSRHGAVSVILPSLTNGGGSAFTGCRALTRRVGQ